MILQISEKFNFTFPILGKNENNEKQKIPTAFAIGINY
jgi:hypothetical protein